MLALLLPLLLLALWLLRRPYAEWRLALIQALLIWGALIVGVTEILSLFRALTPIIVLLIWGVITLGAWALILLNRGAMQPFMRPTLSRWIWLGWGAIALLLLGMVVVGLSSPPNTWDVAAYHAPRIFFWDQFHSIAPFPTHTDRQLYQPPFAEFVMLHLQLLSGGDGLANLVQAAALAFSSLIAAYIASLFGTSSRGQLTAAIVCVTLPVGVMQATGSKNDLITGMWILCAMALTLRAIQHKSISFSEAAQIGLAAGLALLTKGTAYVYLAPLLLWLIYRVFRDSSTNTEKIKGTPGLRAERLRFIPIGLTIGLVMLVVNGPHFARNTWVYGSPLTPASHRVYYANEIFTPAVLISNIVRNLALHIYIPDQVNRVVNVTGAIEGAIGSLHSAIGLDINDPRTTFPWNEFTLPPIWQIFNEDRAGNPLHLLLILAALIAVPFWRKRPSFLGGYALMLLAGFLLFSGLLKWQVWGTRLQLPWFLLAAPLVGVVLERLPRVVNGLINALLLLAAIFWVGNISTRPIFPSDAHHPLAISFYIGSDNINYRSIFDTPRREQYFAAKSELYPPSQEAADQLATMDCTQIGLIGDENTIFHPVMMLIHEQIPNVYMQAVAVTNESRVFSSQPPFSDFVLCAILLQFGAQPLLPETPDIEGRNYQRVWANNSYQIYVPLDAES
jgi:hypothetical protein